MSLQLPRPSSTTFRIAKASLILSSDAISLQPTNKQIVLKLIQRSELHACSAAFVAHRLAALALLSQLQYQASATTISSSTSCNIRHTLLPGVVIPFNFLLFFSHNAKGVTKATSLSIPTHHAKWISAAHSKHLSSLLSFISRFDLRTDTCTSKIKTHRTTSTSHRHINSYLLSQTNQTSKQQWPSSPTIFLSPSTKRTARAKTFMGSLP